jgi:hypothetical protein
MGRANLTSPPHRQKKNACTVVQGPVKAGPTCVAGASAPEGSRLEHLDQAMRSQSEGSTSDGQHKPRRGRDKQAKRWGEINQADIDALFEDVAEEKREADMRFEAITRVSGVLLQGARLMTDAYCVGRISQENEPLRFGCTRKRDGRIVDVYQAYDEGNIDEHGPYAITLRERDWSVFAAARAFVDNVGAEVALDAVRDRHRAQKSVPRARASEVSVSP